MDDLTKYVLISAICLLVVFGILHLIFDKIGKDSRNILPHNFASRIKWPLIILLITVALQVGLLNDQVFLNDDLVNIIEKIRTILVIISITWFIIVGIKIFKFYILRRYDITTKNNLTARKFYTQFNILERVAIFLVIVFAIGISLLTFDGVQEVGLSVLTSAGVAGIILGFAAQKALGTLLAGIQIAITQPIRIDDVVIVKGEWGRIEEITLTYVVVSIWDKRRLVVPTTFFIDTPFENWTKNSADILGTVYLYVDYTVPIDKIRTELTRLLEATELWDKKVNVVQVTDATEKTMEVRALMSAKDSGTAWDLRVYVRENLIKFIQQHYPDSLPTSRISFNPAQAPS